MKRKGFTTQVEVDAEIKRLISLAIKSEERRDRCKWESADYWMHHDLAVAYHNKAESLMPSGKRRGRK